MNDESILSVLPKPLAVFTAHLDVSFANHAFADLFQLRAGDLAALTNVTRSTPSLATAFVKAVARLRTAGWGAKFRCTLEGDEPHVFDVHLKRMAGDSFLAVFDDVSEQVQLEEIQARARRYLESVLNHLSLGVIVLDEFFNTTFFNADQAALFKRIGVERSMLEIIGGPIADHYPVFTTEEWDGIFSRVAGAGETVTWAKLPFPREAPASYYQISFMPLPAEREERPAAICVTEDVTRTVGLEHELIKKERLALVGQMAIALNHEINNPLTAILGTAESMLFRQTLDPDATRRIELIKSNAVRIADVTGRLRGMEEIHLTEYVQGTLMLDLHGRGR
jgi:nitrogen fixation/metabolism regulation signal transduction histidine kinase